MVRKRIGRNIDLKNAVPVRLDVADGGQQRESDAGRAFDHAESAHQLDLHAVVGGVDLVSGDARAGLAVFQCGIEPSAGGVGKDLFAGRVIKTVEDLQQPGGAMAEADVTHAANL